MSNNKKAETNENYLIKDFKINYFIKCVQFGHWNSPQVNELLKYDHSVLSDFPLGRHGYKLVDSLAAVTKKEIVRDSIEYNERWGNTTDHFKAKRVFLICLQQYESSWLDSIALDFEQKSH